MTPFNLRSLLLAAIFLSNCISWTASRHHFTHNVNGHRSRHRRQGAGLFLSASYVLPGGEGSGWGEWGEDSPCSRTCGGGVASQKRICLQIGPEGQPQCSGGDTKYFSCQTQDCPAGSKDFRAEQCSEYDDQLFRDVKYKWVPYTKAPKPCELNCMPHAERFYYRHKERVVDGTRCNDESFDVCVNGTCQPVGCDMMLGSSAKEDKCRVCVGNNVNCHTTSGVLDTVDLRKGYNDMLLIPEGATSIVVAEVGPSNNYLALRAKNGTFYLNGDYHIDFPRNLFIGGAMWTYERSQQGFAAPDKLRCLGPTNENLYLSLLLQDENVGIEYEYSLPTDMAPPQNKRYNWVHEEFTPCSATCGGGFQTRTVSCRSREELEVVDEGLCDEGLRPPTNQSCNTQACSPQWVPGAWGQCSKRCGKGGTRSREVTCQKIISNGYPSIVADKECFDLLGPKPELYQECNANATCPTWFTGPWKPCDKLCDEGKQTRQVVCYQKNGARIEVLGDSECEDERPPAQQACTLQPCDGVDWVVSPWNGCDSCLSKIRTRTMVCATKSHEVVDDSFCSYHPTPSTEETCDPTELPPCETQWYATQWSNCSVTCGEGVQSRKIFCGLFDGTSVLKVPDARCAGQPKYNDTKPCEIPKDKCPSQWFAAPWSDCDKKCGGGDQTRRVMCLRGSERATDCDGETVPASSQSCNTGPCTADELLPVDSTAPVFLDGYEDCEEEEDLYSEVGLDSADGVTPDDMMFSDASMSSEGSGMWTTSYAEMESNFTDTESTLSTDDLITAEGSGGSSTVDFTDDFTTEIDITDETGSGSTITDDAESTVSGASEATVSTESSESTDVTGSSTIASESSDDVGSTTEAIESSTNVSESSDASDSSTVETDKDAAKNTSETVRPTHALPDTGETTKALIFEDDDIETVTTDSEPTGTSDVSEASETTESGATEATETTESGATEATETTESEASSETTSVDASETTELGSTETTESSATETSETTESGSTGSSEATESGATDGTETTEASETSESSSTTDASESGATETTEAIEFNSTETSETGESGTTATTESTESGPTETTETTEVTESGPTEATETTESGPTEATESTESGPTESTETTESGPTEITETSESGATETSETSESGSTETTESGPTETTETTESGPTETTETTESGPTEMTETTETGSTETTETTESDPTETTETTESGPTSETTEFSSLAPESTSESLDASTTEAEGLLTSSAVEWFTSKKPRMCRPRQCTLSQFGCCPDKKTSAGGPFDEGCDKPKTCEQTKYKCCPDGLSPSPTPDKTGCPLLPCAETLFGCCLSDNKTAAEGNDQDNCPPPPPACVSSSYGCCKDGETEATGPEKEGCPETTVPETEPPTSTTALYEGCERTEFGCCFDNVTEATGPEQQGCPCNITQFGCCLDGVSPAQGPDFEGCLKSCKSSAYGCCPDDQTPAHGPNREGCCLHSAFGCCPDNYNYAQGPHLEGCGCQHSPYGCCPDNATSATGYDNKGCGCTYSKHGCCPDGHTEATGPEFEGCACHTYQFGCCPDGITIARGSDGQGCHCLQSKYKCCGDGVTHAAGPNQEGCDCSSSKYGCCPDGRTEATGPKFQGCTDVPEDKQAACGLKFERGSCRNYSVAWYFDMEFGGCSRFWYGGCDGNGNRFASKEECDDTCISPPPKEACKLPQSKGACSSYNVRWYYDSERESCLNFAYGGCLGNNNNFESRELCQKQCDPEKTTDQCNLPIERGSCAGDFPRWGFSSESRRCERFSWGGCGGNSNRFHTEAACTLRCDPPGQPKPECSKPQDVGRCAETEALWAFSQTENRCVPFYYTGCEGNENRFPSLESCESSCPSAYVPDKCTLPYETGNCANYREKWYFDTKDQRCRQFYYGGCGGNENNFDSEQECQSSCQALVTTTTPQPTVAQPTAPVQQARPQTADRPEFCFLEMDVGPCTDFKTSYGYDYKKGRCVTFQYGGCGGNRNNFPDEQYCQYYCKAAQDVCQQPMLSGPCDDSQMRWFYDASTDSCSQFTYGGCEGNDNRFESREECENRCKTGPAVEQTTSTTTTLAVESRIGEELPSNCAISSTLEPCSAATAGEVWYLGASRECVAHNNLAVGAACRATGVFRSQEACERSCGAFRGIDACAYPLDAGRCSSYVAKYFYNATAARCEEFTYGGCMGGPNRFSTELECSEVCKPAIDPCKQQPEPGNCLARYVMWYYDDSSDRCQQFVYGGCGGNDNRFETLEACEGRCRPRPDEVAVTTTTTQVPVQQLELRCTTPSSLTPCGANVTVFYYDAEGSGCRAADFGGCEHENSYRSEEECERNCGAFRGLDVCRAQMDPGPCRAAMPKFYFDSAEGECREFTYGGCRGGPNRFSTLEECEDNCKETGPAAECLEEVSTGSACGELPSRRWHYSRARGGCRVFAYQGCGGNRNNFLSYQECADRCFVSESEEQAALCDRYAEECDTLQTQCEYDMKVTVAAEGCRRCECEPSCERQRQQCETLVCTYGLIRVTEDGCESCVCAEDPCVRANCSATERCVASAHREPATQRVQYTAHCVQDTDSNEVIPECEQLTAACATLSCRYGVQRTSTAHGCVRCACVPEEVDCGKLRQECDMLRCSFGMERTTGEDGCERCQCSQHPCSAQRCGAGERCVLAPYRDAVTHDSRYLADCRPMNKSGECPPANTLSTETSCRQPECNDDADCRGVGKCCSRGCNRLCIAPEETTTPTTTLAPVTQHITTYGPEAPAAPRAGAAAEPTVSAGEGGAATLRCIFHGNPPPRITWRFGELTIDSDYDRYRLKSDGALEIVSLVRNDTGVYVCVADNSLGRAQQEIQLLVTDPVEGPARIADEPRAVTGELGAPLRVRCRAYGHPAPAIYWYRGIDGPMVPYSNSLYEARDQTLTIRSLSADTLGEYACYAYNGRDKPATWVVTVQAYQTDENAIGRYLVPRAPLAVTPRPRTPPAVVPTSPRPRIQTTPYTVEVKTQLLPASTTISAGSELNLPCNVDGFPTPRVSWTKDGVTLIPTDAMWLTDTRLTIPRATVGDSGTYGCHAANQYSSHASTVQITVQEVVIPSKCTDSPYFANCALIVQGKFCRHRYYSKFCCKSCVEAGQLAPSDVDMQADEPFRKK